MLDAQSIQQISDLLDAKFEEKLAPIWEKFSSHDKILKRHEKLLKSLRKDQLVMLDLLDREQIHIKRRLAEIERRVEFLPAV